MLSTFKDIVRIKTRTNFIDIELRAKFQKQVQLNELVEFIRPLLPFDQLVLKKQEEVKDASEE